MVRVNGFGLDLKTELRFMGKVNGFGKIYGIGKVYGKDKCKG